MDAAGAVAIPLILVFLGATLVREEDVIAQNPEVPSQIDPKMEKKGIFLAVFCRMVLVPVLMFPFLITVMYFGVTYLLQILRSS